MHERWLKPVLWLALGTALGWALALSNAPRSTPSVVPPQTADVPAPRPPKPIALHDKLLLVDKPVELPRPDPTPGGSPDKHQVPGGIAYVDTVTFKSVTLPAEGLITLERTDDAILEVSGWAVDDAERATNSEVVLLYRSERDMVMVRGQRHRRPDVADHFEERSYENAGWSAQCDTLRFRADRYQLYLRLRRTDGKYQEVNTGKWFNFAEDAQGDF